MKNLHDILINEIKNAPQGDCALCLSSGVDSASLLFALLECGRNIHVYSFTLEDRESSDFKFARQLANEYDVRFTPILLPIDVETLISDVKTMAGEYGARKKTDFECLWPFLYVYPKVQENIVITGIPADGLFCLSKKGRIHYKDKVDDFRDTYFSNPNAGQRLLRAKLAEKYHKTNVDPYYSKQIIEYLRGCSWDELNKPEEKMPIRAAFVEFNKHKFTRHTNLQLGDSGISEHFAKLLKTELNTNCYKSVVGIYNKIIKDNNDAQVQLHLEIS